MSAPSATCTHHPLRDAVGICVRCSRAMCSDCITKIDGINHCRGCLQELSGTAKPAAERTRKPHDELALGVGVLTMSVLAWLMLEVMMPGAGGP
jgi:hypothetical protein